MGKYIKISGSIDAAGVGGLRGALATVAKTMGKNVIRRAVNLATRPLLKSMKAKVSHVPDSAWDPEVKNQLRRSLGRKVKTYASGTVAGIVGPRKGFKVKIGETKDGKPIMHDPVNIAHLVEQGHAGPAPAPPHPFARPAYDETKNEMKGIVENECRTGLEKEAIKAASKVGR